MHLLRISAQGNEAEGTPGRQVSVDPSDLVPEVIEEMPEEEAPFETSKKKPKWVKRMVDVGCWFEKIGIYNSFLIYVLKRITKYS